MKTAAYITLIVVLLLAAAVILPNSPIYAPIITILQNRIEKNWECDVVKKKASIDILNRTLTLRDVYVRTPENANPNWHLTVNRSIIKLDYRSLTKKRWMLDTLFLDGIVFRHKTVEIPGGESSGNTLPKMGSPEKKPETTQPAPVNINRLIVQDGSFEFVVLQSSGVTDRLKAENLFLTQKNVVFNGNPDSFFRTLVEDAGRVVP